ncbi:MAG TPA: tetratricopeptide repeat protein [Alphaproteobacteria bacterium]|nr:tetratricopeptide repeat protein [Alphaproteobacteria bacterium]
MTDLVAQALAALRQKDFAGARAAMTAFATENQLEFQHYLIKGLAEIALQDWMAARDTFTEASEIFPHQPQVWLNLGVAEENLGDLDDAAESLEQSLDLKAEQGDVCGNLSNVYRKLGRFEDAERMAHRAYELGAPKGQSLNSLGLALMKQGKFEAAERTFQEALRHDATDAHIPANIANCYVDQLKFEAAWPFFAKARALSNDATIRRDEGMARLLAGQYAEGWKLYEARLELPNALRIIPNCPRYNGEPVAGKKILLLAEQGFGDTIMFCRYGKMLHDMKADICWVVQKPVKWLLDGNMPGTITAEGDPMPYADYYIPLLSLPNALQKPSPADAPTTPYLRVTTTAELPDAKTGKKKIGLVWAGSPTHERDHERSIPLEAFAPLFRKLNATFYSPFTGAGLEEITSGTPVIRLDQLITDFADTAAILQALDYLVTVDTATAHLAGALGIKTYLLLQYSPDWRWGTEGISTAWYPSITLLRQPKYGDWESVLNTLLDRLA